MALSFTNELKTEQKQTLSPNMIQSASILQMTAAELETWLSEQALENPVLDLTEKKPEEFEDRDMEKYQWIVSHDEQNRYLYQVMESNDDASENWNFSVENPESLHDHLWNQLLTQQIPAEDEEAYHFLLNSLDARGYFADSLEEFASRFGITGGAAERMLQTVQSLTPAGVGARSLAECLCIQLRQLGQLTPELEEFVLRHLEDVAKNRLPAIARDMNLPLETIKEYRDLIRELDPRPGSLFSDSRRAVCIIPDVIIVKFKDHFDILLNESLYPDVTLNDGYVKMYEKQDDPEVKAYLRDKIRQVGWIRQCIGQRNTTLFKVVQEIVSRQKAFFLRGPSALKPLRLSDVAGPLGIHESTVSRAASGKYLQCPWGTFPISYFFQKTAQSRRAASGGAGDAALADSTAADVKQRLKELIAAEDKTNPLSDQRLSELLSAAGFPVSRRTVAKYRSQEGIPAASGRKEY